jgi:uncharacterized membrane protein YbhN (UPF0104 family)
MAKAPKALSSEGLEAPAHTRDDRTAAADDGQASAPADVESPSRRSAFLRTGFIVLVLVVVFGLILPRFVDYAQVRAALAALTPPQLVLATVIGIVAWFGCGLLYVTVVPGLSALRGNAAYLILTGIGSSIPFGPWNMGVVWVVLRGWGVSNPAATGGIALYGIVNTLGRLALPLLAAVFIVVAGAATGVHTTAIILTAISGLIFVVAAGLMLALVRSDRLADWVGRTADRWVLAVLRRLGRAEAPDVAGSIHRFRDGIGEVVHRRGLAAIGVNAISQLPWCVLFIVSLRLTGVPADVLTPPDVVAVFALTSVITLIPIAPGGAGVPELVYITLLTRIAGPGYDAAITAGVFLFRVYVWFLPIPLAWILLKVVRRGRPMLPTTTELKAYAGATGG